MNRPDVYLDSDVLVSLGCAKTALRAVLDHLGDRAKVVYAVEEESRGNVQVNPPLPGARAAREAIVGLDVVDAGDLGDNVLDRMGQIRERLARPGDHPRKHLGESETLAVVEHLDAIAATDDAGARSIGKSEGIRVVGTTDLLDAAVTSGRLTAQQRADAIEAMRRGGRHV